MNRSRLSDALIRFHEGVSECSGGDRLGDVTPELDAGDAVEPVVLDAEEGNEERSFRTETPGVVWSRNK